MIIILLSPRADVESFPGEHIDIDFLIQKAPRKVVNPHKMLEQAIRKRCRQNTSIKVTAWDDEIIPQLLSVIAEDEPNCTSLEYAAGNSEPSTLRWIQKGYKVRYAGD